MTDPALVAQAVETIAHGSKSFAAAARLFDRRTRESVVLLYAWCRHCDDVVDGQTLGHGQTQGDRASAAARLERLTDATVRAVRGEPPDDPAFAGLAEVVRRHGIPERYPLQHLAGFRMDAEGRLYRTQADLLDYCYHVAGVVGVMMALVMGAREAETLDRACDLGLAFQMTNIARDVIEDAAVGRVYLPEDWLAEEGIPVAEMAEARHRPALARVADRLVASAEPYYRSAAVGLRDLPLRSAWAIATALGVYREIGLAVRARGPAAWDQRITTARSRKAHHALVGGLVALSAQGAGVLKPSRPPRTGLWTRPA